MATTYKFSQLCQAIQLQHNSKKILKLYTLLRYTTKGTEM